MEASDLNGLILESRYHEYQYIIKGPIQTNWQDGFPRQEPKHIVLHFKGFVCLLEDEIRDQELDDDDKLHVFKAIQSSLKNPNFTDMWVHERPRPGMPWPTYAETDVKQIPMVAQVTKTIGAAIAYERDGRPEGPREAVIKKLEDLLAVEVEAEPKVSSDDFAAV